MKFPAWAPSLLVTTLDFSGHQDQHDKSWEAYMRGVLAREPDKAEVLKALLTDPDMEKAWASLYRPPGTKFHEKCREKGSDWFYTRQVPMQLWLTVLRAFLSIDLATEDGRTGAQRRRDLLRLAQAAEYLSTAISQERSIRQSNFDVVLFTLERQNQDSALCNTFFPHRAKPDLSGKFGWDRLAGRIMADVQHAKEHELGRRKAYTALNPLSEQLQQKLKRLTLSGYALPPPIIPWAAKIPEDRVLWWADRALRLKLTEILNVFADTVRKQAGRKEEVHQPNRGIQALRPVLIRGLFRFTYEHFDQPLDDTVAIVVSTVLGGKTLDRDDVKQYRKGVKIVRPSSK